MRLERWPGGRSRHDSWCKWPDGPACTKFSTDGTRLGADIAHNMGTTSEALIAAGQAPNDPDSHSLDASRHLTGMAEEQAEWEHDPNACDDGGCQDEECIAYWERHSEQLGDWEPWKDT